MINHISIFITVTLILSSCFTVVEQRHTRYSESFSKSPDHDKRPPLPVSETELYDILPGTETLILTTDFLRLAHLRDHLMTQGYTICEYNYQYEKLSARISMEEANLTYVLFFRRDGEFLHTRAMWSSNTRIRRHHSRGGTMSTASGDRENPNNNQGRERRTGNDGQEGLERRPDRDDSRESPGREDGVPPVGIITPERPPPNINKPVRESDSEVTRMPRMSTRSAGWELVTRDKDLYSAQGIAFANMLYILTRDIPYSTISYKYTGFDPPSTRAHPCDIDPRSFF